MFENLEPLDAEKHKDLRFSPASDFKFAASVTSAPLSVSEIVDAAKAFPVVFGKEDGPLLPLALMSAKEGTNAYIDADGKWLAAYVPAHIRRYPFILGNTDNPENFTVMVAPDAPHFAEGTGERLFNQDGEKGPTLTKAIEFLSAFQQEIAATEKLMQPLADKDVLTMQKLELTDGEGRTVVFDGVRAVDRDKMKALDDATLAGWVRDGLMVAVEAHLGSLKNFGTIAANQDIKPEAK